MKHKVLQKEESKKLAEEIGDLSYDSLAMLLNDISLKLEKDSKADKNRGRNILANKLLLASINLENAKKEIDKAWDICAPHMISKG